MKIAEVKVAKTTCETTQLVPIPKGIVGATVSIEYMDSAWDGLQKTVVFRSSVTKDVLSSGNEVVIPAEVVSRAGMNLYMGVYGVNTENNVVIPTIWTDLGPVNSAANPSGDTTTDPALPVWAQLQGMIGNLDDLDTDLKISLVAAVNEAMTKGGGEVDEAEIQQIVEDYLAANPPTVEETDPTVPAWAKQPTKPTYTAEEVHAMPDTYTPPIATETTLGGVKAAAATDDMTQPVGITADGKLVTAPSPDSGGNVDQMSVEPAKMDRPKIFFGSPLQQAKDEIVTTFSYRSETLSFDCYAGIKAQGNSTLSWPKKNQTVKLYKDAACTEKFKVDFKGWGKQNKFVIKANWHDLTHVRDIVSVRLEGDCMRSNPDYEELPELLKTSPNLGGIDGFPVVVYAAGIYQGRYMWNIPKDKWMTNMDDKLDEHCILCSEDYNSSCFRAAANINGSDWTDEIHDTVPESIKTRWNEIISFVMNSTDEEFVANLDSHIKVSTLIDRHIMGLYSCDFDGYGKNQLYITYDGKQWYADRYDKDGTWGNYWTGNSMLPSNYGRDRYEDMISGRPGNLLFIRLEQFFYQRLQERWDYLKVNELSIPNTINRFRELYDITPPYVIEEDYASTTANGAFTGIPNKTTCTIQQIEKFVVERHAWMDEYMASLTPEVEVPCTGISLNTNTLTFTAEGSHTLIATVTPEGCTDPVTWESDNTSVATVNGGVVTAIANGSATITAKCGEYSASCVVSVDGIINGSIIYSLPEATTFDGTNHIDTGIKLFDEDKPFTVCLDWTHTDESAFINNNHVIAHCMKEETPWLGLIMQYTSNEINCSIRQFELVTANVNHLSVNTQSRVRVVFTKTADGKCSVITSVDGVKMSESIGVQLTYAHISQSLLLGCYQDTAGMPGRFAKGILNDCKVYNRAISDDEITAYLS